jgi:hypothetical protein
MNLSFTFTTKKQSMAVEEFEYSKSHQYCENPNCPSYGVVSGNNFRVNSRQTHLLI